MEVDDQSDYTCVARRSPPDTLAVLKARIKGLKIKHDGTFNSGGYVRQGVTPTDDPAPPRGRCIR